VFLNDPFEDRRITLSIPGPVRVHDSDGATLTHAQTVGLRSKNAAPLGQTELAQAPLEVTPRLETTGLIATLGSGLITTEKNVPLSDVHTDRNGNGSLTRSAALLRSWSRHALNSQEWNPKNPMIGP